MEGQCNCRWCRRADDWFAVEAEAGKRSRHAQHFNDSRTAGLQDRVRRRALDNAAACLVRCVRRPDTDRPDGPGPEPVKKGGRA